MIVEPYCSRQRHTRSMNASRPIASRELPSLRSSFSTWVCVAMPAWSVPRIHFVRLPRMRLRRISASWTEPLSACPMCSAPVTFGGGIAIEKFSSGVPSGSGWNSPESSQRSTMRGSTSEGSKRLRSFRLDMRGSECMDAPREWDAGSYHGLAQPHQQWGAQILDRLALAGDETVLDLGCGTGRVTEQLLERLGPAGHVIGVDGSARMVAEAERRLGGDPRASFVQQDLLALAIEPPADAAVSSATFHWIKDHDTLFARVRAALREGAPFVAQCGGRGNIASVVVAVVAVAGREPFAEHFAGWPGPWNYAGPQE